MGSRLSLLLMLAVVASACAAAQDDPTPTGDCIDYSGHVVRCSSRSSGGSSGSDYSGPSAAEIEAEHQREAERARLAEAQRKAAAERERAAEKKKQEEAEWKRGVAEAAGSLKGVSPDNMEIRGASTGFFGLKGVSVDEAASNPGFGIKVRTPDNYSRDVSTAWKQLHCANEIAGYALSDLRKIETDDADARELDEIKYLAGEAGNALDGNAVGVQCSAAPATPTVKGFDPQQASPIEKKLLARTVQDAESIVTSRQRIEVLQQKLDDLKAQKPSVDATKPTQARNSTTPSSQTGQRPSVSADQQHINDVIRQQKDYQKAIANYYALLRDTQHALNEANSQKIASAADAEKVEKETQAIMAGQPNSPSNISGQTQKKKLPGDDQ